MCNEKFKKMFKEICKETCKEACKDGCKGTCKRSYEITGRENAGQVCSIYPDRGWEVTLVINDSFLIFMKEEDKNFLSINTSDEMSYDSEKVQDEAWELNDVVEIMRQIIEQGFKWDYDYIMNEIEDIHKDIFEDIY